MEKIDAFTAEKSDAASDPTPIASDLPVDTSEPAFSETVSPYGFIEEPIERGTLFRSLEEFKAWFASDQVEERVTPERLAAWRGDETIRYFKPVGLIAAEDLQLVEIEVDAYAIVFSFAYKDKPVNGSNYITASYHFDGSNDTTLLTMASYGIERGEWTETQTPDGNKCYHSKEAHNGVHQKVFLYNNKVLYAGVGLGNEPRISPEDFVGYLTMETVTLPLK